MVSQRPRVPQVGKGAVRDAPARETRLEHLKGLRPGECYSARTSSAVRAASSSDPRRPCGPHDELR